MFRKNIDPEEAVNQSTVHDKTDKTGKKECPGVLCHTAGKSRTETENRIKHEGFSNTITDTENQNGQGVEQPATVGSRVGVDPGVDGDNHERGDNQRNSSGIELPIEGHDIFPEKEKTNQKSQGPVSIDHHWYRHGVVRV